MNFSRWIGRSIAAFAAMGLLIASPALAEAQQGTITGRVVDARTGSPVVSAQVQVVGTQLGTLTDREGNFRIANVAPGTQQVRALFIGFRTATVEVQVTAGQVAVANFTLSESAVALDELIVTGTAGRQERRAQAASIASIDAAALTEIVPITNITTLLQGRSTGIAITQTSGTSGTGQRIRLRGAASLSLSNDPIIIVDGLRLDSRTTQIYGVGGQVSSRLNDINPDDIESIEVVKGPAAATLYGADASAGVIQIRTKRGRAGSGFTQTVAYEFGTIDANFTPDANFQPCGAAQVAASWSLCFGKAVGDVVSDNPLVRNDIIQQGERQAFSWSARGGGDQYGYFLSFAAEDEQGTMPDNKYRRYTSRVNFDFTPRSDLRLEASIGLGRVDTRMPQNDNNGYGYLGGGMLGSPLTVGNGIQDGWFGARRQLEAISSIETSDMAIRVTPSIAVNYNPIPWFSNRLNIGVDMTRTEAYQFYPLNAFAWYGNPEYDGGWIGQARQNRDEITLDYLGSVRRPIGDSFTADLAFGGQAIATRSDFTEATGIGLTTNAARAINAAARTTGGQSYGEAREAGIFSQLDLAYQDRLYLQVGARVDRNAAFGENVSSFFNPKVGLSYVVSEEDFYPAGLQSFVPTLRLRSVWGSTGRSPGTTASLTTFSSSPYALSPTVVRSGVVPANPGNSELEPERGVEIEFGFDAGLFNERVGLEVTYYDKTSKNLILSRPIPASLGFTQNPAVNIGELKNNGWEVGVNARVYEQSNFSWDARVNLSTNSNKVTDLGDVEPFGVTQQVRVGYPARGYWQLPVVDFDVANNRVILGDTLEFLGNPEPGMEGNFSSTFSFGRSLRIFAQFAWMRDFYVYNGTDEFRDRQFVRSERAAFRNDLDPEDRLLRFGPWITTANRVPARDNVLNSYLQDGSFLRFQELSVSYSLPSDLVRRIGANGATVTVAGRNLGLWTNYEGPDPEVIGSNLAVTGGGDFRRTDFLTLPQPRRFTARVNLTF
jgi:TonB-dependent starch-binding outer membrane protein SusC